MSLDKAFIMHAEEDEAAEDWIVGHECDPQIDQKISYTFSHGSGIGVSIIVSCLCGEKKDVTNYARW